MGKVGKAGQFLTPSRICARNVFLPKLFNGGWETPHVVTQRRVVRNVGQ